MPTEILAALIGLAGAVIGYAFREYRNRARPFFQVTTVDGGMLKMLDEHEVEESITSELEDSFYIKKIEAKCLMRDIDDRWDKADDVKRFWPQVKDHVDQVLSSTKDESITDSLSRLLSLGQFDRWMMLLLVNDKLSFENIPSEDDQRVATYRSQENNGSLWISFPNNAVNFGNNLQVGIIKSKVIPFIRVVTSLDKEIIFETLRQFKNIMEIEYQSAVSVVDDLKKIRDQNSRWAFMCYFANLSKNPVIIDNKSKLLIADSTGVKYQETCYLAVIQPDENDQFGASKITDTKKPLVVRPSSDIEFVFITTKTQEEMSRGSAIREAYDRGEASLKFSINIRKVGLFKRQKYETTDFPFVSSSGR
jgi:hypothetical protein